MEHEAIALAARQKIRELDAAIEEQKAKKQKTVVEPLQQKREDDFDTDTINNAFQQVITIMQLPLLARHDLHGLEPDQVVALKYVAETSRTPDEFRLVRVNKNHFQGGRQVIRLTIGSDEIEKEKALKYLYEHVEDAYLVRGGLEEFLDKFQGIMAETSSALQLVTPGMSAPSRYPTLKEFLVMSSQPLKPLPPSTRTWKCRFRSSLTTWQWVSIPVMTSRRSVSLLLRST